MDFMSLGQITQAAYMAGQNANANEIATAIGVKPRHVRQGLALACNRLAPSPYGFKRVQVTVSPAQLEGLRTVAQRQGLAGLDRHSAIAEQALRRLGADVPLLSSVLDATLKPIFVPEEALDPLKDEAKRRGMTVDALAGFLLEAIGRDGIVKAVLDA